MQCYTSDLNSYNKGAVTMFLRGLRANPTPGACSNLDALFVDVSLRFTARNFRVRRIFKVAASRNFETYGGS